VLRAGFEAQLKFRQLKFRKLARDPFR
jgi:hypothetical protein